MSGPGPVSFRLDADELAAVDAAARASGLSRSAWLRQVALAAAGRGLLGEMLSAAAALKAARQLESET